MDEKKPLIRYQSGVKQSKKSQNAGWDTCQFVWILLSLMAYTSAGTLLSTVDSQYVYSRVAQEHSLNTSEINTAKQPCLSSNSSSQNTTDLDEVQADTTQWLLILCLCRSVPSSFMNVFLGIHSDSWGRKPFLIIPILGGLIRSVLITVTVHWSLPLYVIAIGYIGDGLSGSFYAMLVSSFSCIADITSTGKTRTFFITVFNCVTDIVGSLLIFGSGYFIGSTGFFYPVITVPLIYSLSLLIQCCFVKETLKTRNTSALRQRLRAIISMYVDGEERLLYIICLSIFFLQGFTSVAGVTTLYAMNEPFCFSSVELGWLFSAGMLFCGLGGMLLLKLSHFCLSDETVAVISILSSGGSMVLQALGQYKYQLFLVPVAGAMGSLVYSLMRGILSRATDPKQQGALFGSFGAVEPLSFMASSLLSNLIYEKTVAVYPPTVFFVVAGLCGVMLLLFIPVLIRKTPKAKGHGSINNEVNE